MDVEQLRKISLFSALHDHTLKRIAELSSEFEVPAGWVLIEPGQPGSGMFVLEEGTVRVETPDGRSPRRRSRSSATITRPSGNATADDE